MSPQAGRPPLSGSPLATLRRITTNRPAPITFERCEMCAEPISEAHQHVVNLESRALMCTCRACYLLFADEDAELRYRAVPDRYLSFPDFVLGPGQWDELEIPVGLAFLFRNSVLGRTVAFYPGPAGATESELPLEAWEPVVGREPRARAAPRRRGGAAGARCPSAGAPASPATSCRSTPATSWSAGCASSGAGSTAARTPARRWTRSSTMVSTRSRPAPAVGGSRLP